MNGCGSVHGVIHIYNIVLHVTVLLVGRVWMYTAPTLINVAEQENVECILLLLEKSVVVLIEK